MNFGKWILVSFILFALFIGSLVILCYREDVSLVSKNYYDEELSYQQQIERKRNLLTLDYQPTIRYTKEEGIKITMPENVSIQKGELKLFCPSNAKLDEQFALASSSVQSFKWTPKSRMYRVKMRWVMNDKEYYFEDQITL